VRIPAILVVVCRSARWTLLLCADLFSHRRFKVVGGMTPDGSAGFHLTTTDQGVNKAG
jgi:hypothetical protein